MSTFFKRTVSVNRLSYTGNKGTFSAVSTFKAYLRLLNEADAGTNGFQYGQAYALICPIDADIQKTDTVDIDGETYTVEGVGISKAGLSVDHKRALVTKPQNR